MCRRASSDAAGEPARVRRIVGASTAGCTAARLLALAGARIALIERKPAADAYKTICTHFIQPSAAPVIRRLGLAELIDARGATRNRIDMWTPYGGWIRSSAGVPHGYYVTRRTLDPVLRDRVASTPGVEYLPGWSATAFLGNGRPSGVEIENRQRERKRVPATLTGRRRRPRLGDRPHGRHPRAGATAERFLLGLLARGATRRWPLAHVVRRARLRVHVPKRGRSHGRSGGAHRDRLREWRGDPEAAYARFIAGLPDAPDLGGAQRESKLLGKLELPNVMRPAARPGVALVGDSALASDPLWGVGCGWAFQSAAWLADEVGPALVAGGRRRGTRPLPPDPPPPPRTASLPDRRSRIRTPGKPDGTPPLPRGTRDPFVLGRFEQVGRRRRSPARLLDPRALARMVRAGRRRA